METRKCPWKRKPSESESSDSFSSHSERCSDVQEEMRGSPNDNLNSVGVSSKATISDEEMKESVKSLAEKLSSALVNVSAKEELVKQHAKVAEEAVAGWEKAENEVASLKQQLEVALQQNMNLEVKTSHLDSTLKECVRQLRQARDEHEKRFSDALMEKNSEWESMKAELQKRILQLEAEKSSPTDHNALLTLEKGNLSLKKELVSCLEEIEILTIERDLSIKAAESASRLQLESIKKVAKLEAEGRRLQSISCRTGTREANGPELGCLGSQASALPSGPDSLKKASAKNKAIEIDMMDDFLEMERLAALDELGDRESVSVDNSLRDELDSTIRRVADLESTLEKMEVEKLELQNTLDETVDSLKKAENMLQELQNELSAVGEMKESLEFKLISMEEESRTVSANVDSLKAEIGRERQLSTELKMRCRELENELTRTVQETEIQQTNNSNGEFKIKQEDLTVAADKLAECQKTIASLGRQLQSLATLEDFLIDTSSIPGFSRDTLGSDSRRDIWRLSCNETFVPNCDSGLPRTSMENCSYVSNGHGNDDASLSSSSSSSTNNGTSVKSRNSFGKFFC